MGITTSESLLDAVAEVGPLIREHAGEAEAARRLSAPVMDALRGAGLFRMLLPRSLGGLEVDPVTLARVVEAVSRHDSAAGWALQAGNLGDWWGARLPDEGAEEVFGGTPDAVMAAAFHPPMEGVAVDGGVRVTGRRPLASTIHDADWLLVTAVVGEGAVATVVRADEARVVDTWYSLGMRGTDSNDVVLEDVFVPARRTFPLMPDFVPGAHYGGPLYRMSAVSSLAIILAPIALASAREAIEALRQLAPAKTSLGSMRTLQERSTVHARLGRAEGLVRAARALLYTTMEESWAHVVAGGRPDLERRAGDLLAGAHAVRAAVEAVDLVYGAAGSSAVYERSPIERHFRDVQTVRHHGFICEARFEAVGQVLLGVEPEFGLVAF
ncbi:MAG: acyl-CoA dehydrogenase family protein [Actinomycetota bacterium]